jgi:hypothetical protein
MLTLFPTSARVRRFSRRQWGRMTAFAAGGLLGSAGLPLSLFARSNAVGAHATAKRCIYIFLCGGPSQPDLWDMKPDAPVGIRSEFAPLQTSVPGTLFSELIPHVARHADKLALIRSMTHSNNDHVGAIVHSLLGQLQPNLLDMYVKRYDHPGLGAILHSALGDCGELPPWVVLPRPFGTSSPPYKGQSAGFLGAQFDPLQFAKEPRGSLTDAPLKLDAIQPGDSLSSRRFVARRDLLATLDEHEILADVARTQNYDRAFGLLTAPETRRAFDLEQEPAGVRDRYGRNEYGQSLLMARRLVESGVRFVNVFWTFFEENGCQFNLWDNHGVPSDVCGIDDQLTGRQQITHEYCTPSFDRSFPALLEDLEERGLLDDTLVVVAGEFGRTPRINQTSGRDHWARCYTQLLAGGGVQGGAIHGASDATGAFVLDKPVTPDDFHATVLHAFGIEPETAIYDRTGRPVRVTSGEPVTALF